MTMPIRIVDSGPIIADPTSPDDQVVARLMAFDADVVCVQEIKCTQDDLTPEFLARLGC